MTTERITPDAELVEGLLDGKVPSPVLAPMGLERIYMTTPQMREAMAKAAQRIIDMGAEMEAVLGVIDKLYRDYDVELDDADIQIARHTRDVLMGPSAAIAEGGDK